MDADAIPWKISFPRQGLMQCFVTWLYSDGRHQFSDSWIRLIHVRYFKVSFRRKPNFRLWLNAHLGNSMDNFLSKLAKFKFRWCLKLGPVINTPELSDTCPSLLYQNSHLGTNYTETGQTWLSPNPYSCVMCFVHPWNLEESKEKCHPREWKSILPSNFAIKISMFCKGKPQQEPHPGGVSAMEPSCLCHLQRKVGSHRLTES